MLRTIKRPPQALTSRQIFLLRHRCLSTKEQNDDKIGVTQPSTEQRQGQRAVKDDTLANENEQFQDRLRKWAIENLRNVRMRMDDFTAMSQLTFQRLGGRLNEVTGYHEIQALKDIVVENEKDMLRIREESKAAKEAYEKAVAKRSASQRETNDLLQRKSTWSEEDVLNFTRLVRADHIHEQEEARTKARYAELDAAADKQFAELMRTILARYHEEQVWSDKIRSASTYGSLAALGLNLAVFVLAIVLVEPWKRKRLVQSFEQRVVELNSDHQKATDANLDAIKAQVDSQWETLASIQAMLLQSRSQSQLKVPENELGEEMEISIAPLPAAKASSTIISKLLENRGTVQTVVGSFGGIAIGLLLGNWCR